MQSKGHTRLDAGCKGQSLKDGRRAFSWKFFFQTQQQGPEQAEEPLSTNVVMHLKPSSDPMQMLMLCGDLPGDIITCFQLIL
ncbi:hypothetical protein TNCV_4679321 [Trichonephila clavipes]|nr:hypothetical protein TNCV_4679321 [Trichonephila clavipes]